MAPGSGMYWLGLDVGTGGSRALLVDATGRVRSSFTAPHEEMQMARPLWAEQDPNDWWHASQAAIRGVLKSAGVDGASVAGVGLTGQMHGLVMLDAKNEVIRPALIWCDQRSQRQVDFINRKIGSDEVVRHTANPVLTGFTLPKLLWVREHEPQAFAGVRKILLPKDYIRFKLTGEFATDVSDASGTALFDVARRKWSEEMVSGLGLDRAILPPALESQRGLRRSHGNRGPADRVSRIYRGNRWRGGSGGERNRKRHCGAGFAFLHRWNVGRCVCVFGEAGV